MRQEKKVRTREAPSPTGYPHVGTAFQVLFNWIYAHKHQGKFIVRIEDTDQKRFVPEAEQVIFDALDWLGLVPDESPIHGGPYGPYRQSERLDIYKKHVQELLDKDKAYHCFCSEERLKKMRQEQQKKGEPPKYDRQCLGLSKEEVKKRLAKGEKAAVRMKIPDNRKIIVHDLLRGEVEFDSNLIDDQVILKSDGFPTYHLAVVVDDHLMEITHMKRGEEWLPSAPKHILLYEYFGWEPPKMIHTPIIRNPDRSKLSKRQGHTNLWWYRSQGYLQEALLNFLATLVWNHPEDKEVFTKEEMMKYFEWDQMRYLGPIFDLQKLEWFNSQWMRQLSLDQLMDKVKKWAEWTAKQEKDPEFSEVTQGAKKVLEWIKKDAAFFKKCLKLAQERLKKLSEIPEVLAFYYVDKLKFDRDDLLQNHEPSQVISSLELFAKALQDMKKWDPKKWEKEIRTLADSLGWQHKDLFMILRSAVTARKATPPLYGVMMVLGKERIFDRIDQAIKFLK